MPWISIGNKSPRSIIFSGMNPARPSVEETVPPLVESTGVIPTIGMILEDDPGNDPLAMSSGLVLTPESPDGRHGQCARLTLRFGELCMAQSSLNIGMSILFRLIYSGVHARKAENHLGDPFNLI